MRLRAPWIVLTLLIVLAAGLALLFPRVRDLGSGIFPKSTWAETLAERQAATDRTAYTLAPAKLRKAVALQRIDESLTISETVWPPLQMVLILGLGIAAGMRNLTLRLTARRWVQCFVFVFLLLSLMTLLDLPFAIYAHHVGLVYGLSVQGWASWLADKGKSFALEWGIGGLLVMLMFWVVGRSPRRWWFWFWIPTVACVVAGVFVTPYVIDPLFNKFEPLEQTDPALVRQLERVVARTGISIPPDRMFLMKASAKYTGLNAYVTGFGASKRVVVWDTTIAKATPDEIAFIFGHELGHYALDHIVSSVVCACVLLLPFFWLASLGVRFLLRRYGGRWHIASQQDWAALAVFLLVFYVLSIAADPIANGYSRMHEHEADVYGEEAVHGIVANPQAVGRQAFQVLGEESLDDPAPHPYFEFWFGDHPPIYFRAAFARAYDPWAPGMRPRYFAK